MATVFDMFAQLHCALELTERPQMRCESLRGQTSACSARPHHAAIMHVTQSSAPPLVEPELGIWFDGRFYHYQQYCHERLQDALAYALLDRNWPGFHPEPLPERWEQWRAPDQDEAARMAPLEITYEHGRYCYGAFRYDVLDDALDYARYTLSAPGQH